MRMGIIAACFTIEIEKQIMITVTCKVSSTKIICQELVREPMSSKGCMIHASLRLTKNDAETDIKNT